MESTAPRYVGIISQTNMKDPGMKQPGFNWKVRDPFAFFLWFNLTASPDGPQNPKVGEELGRGHKSPRADNCQWPNKKGTNISWGKISPNTHPKVIDD